MFIAPLSFVHGLFESNLLVNAGNPRKPRVSKRLLDLLKKMEKEKDPAKREFAYLTLKSLLKHSREKNNMVLVLINKLNSKKSLIDDKDDHSFCVRVIDILGETRDKRATPILLRWFKNCPQIAESPYGFENCITIKKNIAKVLGKIKDHRAVPDLIAIGLGHQDGEVREASAWALGEIRDPRAIISLVKMLERRDYLCNLYFFDLVIRALAKIKTRDTILALIGCFKKIEKCRIITVTIRIKMIGRRIYKSHQNSLEKIFLEIADEKVVKMLKNAAKDTLRRSGNWGTIARIIEVFKKAVKKIIDIKYNQYRSIIEAAIIINSRYLTASRYQKQQIISQLRRKVPPRLISVLLRQGARGFNMQMLLMLPLDLRQSLIAKKQRGGQTVKVLRAVLGEIEASKNKEYSRRICELPSKDKAFCNIIKELKRRKAEGSPVYIGQPSSPWDVK